MEAITFKDVSIAYHHKVILKDFSTTIHAGEFIGVFGPNGAGKSTLFKSILGLLPLKHGEIFVFDQPISRGNHDIGYMPQNRNLIVPGLLSGRARLKICVNGDRYGLPNIRSDAEIDNAIALVEAQSYADRPFYQLSGGEKQRFLFAQAILTKPKILLLDEPLLNLDPHACNKLIELIAKIQKQFNITVLFSSHAINPLINVMNRIIYIAHGKAAMGTVAEVINSEKLSWLYGYPVEVFKHGKRLFILGQDTETLDHDNHH